MDHGTYPPTRAQFTEWKKMRDLAIEKVDLPVGAVVICRASISPSSAVTSPYIAHCMGASSAKREWSIFSLAPPTYLSPLYISSLHRAPHST